MALTTPIPLDATRAMDASASPIGTSQHLQVWSNQGFRLWWIRSLAKELNIVGAQLAEGVLEKSDRRIVMDGHYGLLGSASGDAPAMECASWAAELFEKALPAP